jgi:hypothetical protein
VRWVESGEIAHEGESAGVCWFRDGKIIRWQPFETHAAALEAAGACDVALLDKQLMEWMERRRAQKSAESRRRADAESVVQGSEGLPSSVRQQVVERIARKILTSWDKVDQESDPLQSLREQVIERVAAEILRRWQRSLE